MFTHRPELFGQLGIAREIAGIYGHAFTRAQAGIELMPTNPELLTLKIGLKVEA
jgi:hypothetical protein